MAEGDLDKLLSEFYAGLEQECVSAESLQKYRLGLVHHEEWRKIEDHVGICGLCRFECMQLEQDATLPLRALAWQLARRFIQERHKDELSLFESLRSRFDRMVDRVCNRQESRWSFGWLQLAPVVAFASGTGKLAGDLATPAAQYVSISVLADCSARAFPVAESELRKIIRRHVAKAKCREEVAQQLEDFLVENLSSNHSPTVV